MSQSRSELVNKLMEVTPIINNLVMERQASISLQSDSRLYAESSKLLSSLPENSEKFKILLREQEEKRSFCDLFINQQRDLGFYVTRSLKEAWAANTLIDAEKIIASIYREIYSTKTSQEVKQFVEDSIEELKALASASPAKPKQAADSKETPVQQATDNAVLKELTQLKDQVAKLTDAVTMLTKQLAEKSAADKTPTMLSSAYNPKMGFAKSAPNG